MSDGLALMMSLILQWKRLSTRESLDYLLSMFLATYQQLLWSSDTVLR